MILADVLIVLASAVFSVALRTYRSRMLRRLGTLGIFFTSFLAGWLIGGHVVIGIAFAVSWLLLPWLEILTRVRKMRLPIDRQIVPRMAPGPADFPRLRELTDELEAEDFEYIDDLGWEFGEQQQFMRVFYQSKSRTEAAVCLIEQGDLAFYYVSITSRATNEQAYLTWNYPFSYGLRTVPDLQIHRLSSDCSFSEMLSEHRLFLDQNQVGVDQVIDQAPENLSQRIQDDLRKQISHNIDRGLLVRDGNDLIRYSVRGFFFLWFQFLRDLVRLS